MDGKELSQSIIKARAAAQAITKMTLRKGSGGGGGLCRKFMGSGPVATLLLPSNRQLTHLQEAHRLPLSQIADMIQCIG